MNFPSKFLSLTLGLVCAAVPGTGTGTAAPGPVRAATSPVQAEAPRIEVLFVLDTTGSMGGLIEGAKQKIWSIANQFVAAKPTPRLKIGLLPYRDNGDEYVTKLFDLSEDIDTVYRNLQGFQAAGGGDAPESVNQALHEAVTRPSWSADRRVLKIVFLVGDYPPHMDYPQDVRYPDSCQAAVKRDILINTVQCGNVAETTRFWKEIARLGEGSYTAIGQTGDMQVVSTPMDAELGRLNAAVGNTIVAYGGESKVREVMAKQVHSEKMASVAPAAVADRLAFNMATGRVVQGGGDLLDDLKRGDAQLEKLDKEQLPKEMRGMNREQQQAHLKAKEEERSRLRARIAELGKQRQAYVEAELKKLAAQGKGDAFDAKVAETIRAQARRKGIQY